MVINEFGQVIEKVENEIKETDNINSRILNNREDNYNEKPKKEYSNVKDYKPTGNFIYRPEFFDKIEKKMN